MPAAFIALHDVQKKINQLVSVIGVVIDYRPPMLTRTVEYTTTVTICDQTMETTGITARIFRGSEHELPRATSNGDIIILRGMKVSKFRGNLILLSGKSEYSHILSRLDGSKNFNPPSVRLSQEDMAAIRQLRTWWTARDGNSPAIATIPTRIPTRERKLIQIREIHVPGHQIFCAIIGYVVKTFNAKSFFAVYVTDYTSNNRLFDYRRDEDVENSHRWLGPLGQYTLQVSFWSNQMFLAQSEIREGQYLAMSNLRIKCNRDGIYEGDVNDDPQNPEQPQFAILDRNDERVRDIKTREREYERRITQGTEKSPYRKAETTHSEVTRHTQDTEKGGENDQVKCMASQVTMTSIGDIKANKSSTRLYHITCKVLQYLPQNIEDFACEIPEDESEDDNPGDPATKSENKWGWRFALLVEGRGGETMRIIVDGKGAECLLKMQATDLRQDKVALAEVRKKLTILWGSLEDKRLALLQQQVDNQPDAVPQKAKGGGGRKRRVKGKPDNTNKKPRTEGSKTPHLDKNKDEDEGREEVEAKFFEAGIQEYSVEKADGSLMRMWKLIHTTIEVET